jgi:hypothetical protein
LSPGCRLTPAVSSRSDGTRLHSERERPVLSRPPRGRKADDRKADDRKVWGRNTVLTPAKRQGHLDLSQHRRHINGAVARWRGGAVSSSSSALFVCLSSVATTTGIEQCEMRGREHRTGATTARPGSRNGLDASHLKSFLQKGFVTRGNKRSGRRSGKTGITGLRRATGGNRGRRLVPEPGKGFEFGTA